MNTKRSPNRIKLHDDFSWTRRHAGDLESKSEEPRGGGNGVDVEALRDRIPLRQDAGKGPKMGSHGYRRLWRWKSGFVAPLDVFGV